MGSKKSPPVDSMALAGLFLMGMMLCKALTGGDDQTGVAAAQAAAPGSAVQVESHLPNPEAVAAPYEEYILTQGLHGYSYGHAAIDLTAGEGAPVLSPIYGEVADLYTDEWGNPNLVIENERYRVSLLHGSYTGSIGQSVYLGEVVGYESNQGYTVDYLGQPCAGRDCGYHTHLNIFDKQLGQNINPLDLFDK